MVRSKLVLVVESEAEVADVLVEHLRREGYEARVARDGQEALAEVRRHLPDVVILDRALPRMSGDEVAMRLRADSRTGSVPIVMVSSRGDETDELISFALGADDYVRKPFSTRVVLARIQAILRRYVMAGETAEVLTAGPIALDRGRHELTVEGEPVSVTATEFRLLGALMAARGRVLSREQLIDAALGFGAVVTDRTIDVHVVALRRKLGQGAGWVHTVRGFGYALRPPPGDES